MTAIVKVRREGIGDADRPVSRYVYRITSDELQYLGVQIWWKLKLRRCGEGKREERNIEGKGKDEHRRHASYLCTRDRWARVEVAEQLYTS